MSAPGVAVEEVLELLRQVTDPELHISIVELGLVAHIKVDPPAAANIELRLCYLGCPAQATLMEDIRTALAPAGYTDVAVRFAVEHRWTTEQISTEGLTALGERRLTRLRAGDAVRCPHCNGDQVCEDSPFGSSVCRATWFCNECHTPFEALRSSDCGRPRRQLFPLGGLKGRQR